MDPRALLKARKDSIQSAITRCKDYIDKLNAVTDMFARDDDWKKAPTLIAKLADGIQRAVIMDENLIKELIDLSLLMENMIAEMRSLLTIMSSMLYIRNIGLIIVGKVYESISAARLLAINECSAVIDDTESADKKLYLLFVKELLSDASSGSNNVTVSALLSAILEQTVITSFLIILISELLLMPGLPSHSREILRNIMEIKKDALLGSNRIPLLDTGGIQGMFVRYNLVPYEMSMPPQDLFKKYKIEYIHGDKNNFPNLAVAAKLNVCAIFKSGESPLEFNIRGLVDPEYIERHELKVSMSSGVTKKMIEKFNTYKKLKPPPGKKNNHKNIIAKYSDEADWLVLETINGAYWRRLSHMGALAIKASNISGLINGLTLRPHVYNDLQAQAILAKCFDSRSPLILSNYISSTANKLPSDVIKNGVHADLVKLYLAQPPGISKFITYFTSDKIAHAVENRLHRSFEVAIIDVNLLASRETVIENIIWEFTKAIEILVRDKRDLVTRASKMDPKYLDQELREIHDLIINGAIDMLDKTGKWNTPDLSLSEFYSSEYRQIFTSN